MDITLFTQADLGTKKNQLTLEATSIIDAIEPKKIYCRDHAGYGSYPTKSIIPGGSLLPKSLTVINIVTKGHLKFNYLQYDLIGLSASWKNIDTKYMFLHPACYDQLLDKKKDVTSIMIVSSTPTSRVSNILKHEHSLVGNAFQGIPAQKVKNFDQANFIITYSDFTRDALIEDGIDKGKIISCALGVDAKRFTPDTSKKNKEKFIVLTVSDFNIGKGLLYLLEAWKSLDLKNAELWIMGHKDAYTVDLLDKYKLPSIKLIPHGDPQEMYQKADVFVLPTLFEGSAKVVYEASATQTPCIATMNSGAVVRNNKEGQIVPIQDSAALAKAIKKYYDDPKLVETHGKAARKLMLDNYTWQDFSDRIKKAVLTFTKNINS